MNIFIFWIVISRTAPADTNMKSHLLIFILILCSLRGYSHKADTFQVYFAMGDSRLSKESTARLDVLIFNGVLIHGQKLIVLGFTDYVGDNAYNDALSLARAKNVQTYLVASGFEAKDIRLCLGKGKIKHAPVSGKDGIAEDRKVQLIIDRQKPPDTAAAKHGDLRKIGALGSTSNLKVNATYPLNILFENSSSVILGKSYPVLQQLYDFMVRNKTVSIQIEGHICCIPPSERADGHDINGGGPVSWHRAKAIYDFLIARGISKDRLKYIGLGGTVPAVYPEKTEADKEANRRVEIRILSK